MLGLFRSSCLPSSATGSNPLSDLERSDWIDESTSPTPTPLSGPESRPGLVVEDVDLELGPTSSADWGSNEDIGVESAIADVDPCGTRHWSFGTNTGASADNPPKLVDSKLKGASRPCSHSHVVSSHRLWSYFSRSPKDLCARWPRGRRFVGRLLGAKPLPGEAISGGGGAISRCSLKQSFEPTWT